MELENLRTARRCTLLIEAWARGTCGPLVHSRHGRVPRAISVDLRYFSATERELTKSLLDRAVARRSELPTLTQYAASRTGDR